MSENKVGLYTILDPSHAECRDIIMNYLENDLDTLYSCIQVNRSFCRIFIPILWKNPFKFVKNENKLVKIFNTLIHCLDASDKNYLTAKSINIKDLPATSKAYFKYHTLIKEFELNSLQKGMRLWISEYLSKFANQARPSRRRVNERMIKLNDYIGNLLFSQGNQYNSIGIFHDDSSRPNFLFDICKFNNHEESLAKVNKLTLEFYHRNTNTNLIPKITENFLTLQNALPNIQHLQISFDTTGSYSELLRNLINFIQSQQNLKSLLISVVNKEEFHRSFNLLLNALKNHSKSLTFLRLKFRQFTTKLVPILKSLPNLIILELDFIIDSNKDVDVSREISSLHFNNLEHLSYLSHSPTPSNSLLFKRILLSSNNNLKSLKINYSTFIKEVQQEILLNLTHFHLIMTPNIYSFNDITNLLKNLHQLVHLKLTTSNQAYLFEQQLHLLFIRQFSNITLTSNSNNQNNFNDLSFKEFSQSLSNSLKTFEVNFTIPDKYLRILLNESQCNFQCIKLHRIEHEECDNLLGIFINYSRRKKCFKELGFSHNSKLYFSENCIKKVENRFNITMNNKIDDPFYDVPINNSHWSSNVSPPLPFLDQ